MAVVVKSPATIQIVSRRATCLGIQYTVSDGEHTHITTFTPSGQFVSCTCGLHNYSIQCAHRRLGQAQEHAYVLEAQQREAFVSACSIY